MKKSVVYARYSCDRQTEQSIEGQIRACKDFAERNGIEIVQIYIDRAMSGTNDDRENFQKMLSDSDKKEWDFVLVYKLDRFSRNKYEMAIHRKRLSDNGIKILSAMENIPDSPEGILLESLLEGMNQYYSEELSQKTKRGLNETRLKGHFIGGNINFGWSLIDVTATINGKPSRIASKVILNESEAAVVKEIFECYANRKSVADIVKDFGDRGILCRGKPFKAAQIYTILRREKYTGIYRINGVEYDKIYPQIISPEVYRTVKARIDANKYGSRLRNKVSYLLKGKIVCGGCGKPFVSFTGTSKSGSIYRYYRCIDNARCRIRRTFKKDVLDEAVIAALRKALSSQANLNLLTDKIIQNNDEKIHNKTELKILEKELAKTEKSLSNLIAAIESGLLTASTKDRLHELENMKSDLKNKISEEKSKAPKPIIRSEVEKYITKALEQSSENLIDLLVQKVIIKDEAIEIYLKYANTPPPDLPRKRGRPPKQILTPERTLSEQGCFFMKMNYKITHKKTKNKLLTDNIAIKFFF